MTLCRRETLPPIRRTEVSVRIELEENDGRSLVEVGCLRNKSSIQLIVHADGGGWPTEAEISKRNRDPTKIKSLAGRITRHHPDIMGLDDENPRVKMSCGDVIASSSLALHCYYELKKGSEMIRCPDAGCNAVWSFNSIVEAACLSPNETKEFERKMLSNKIANQSAATKRCPGCESVIRLNQSENKLIYCRKCTSEKGRKFEFCWSCLMEWRNENSTQLCGNLECGDLKKLFECLATCKTKTLNGIECPSRRACPKCMMLIDHTAHCKHMTCRNKSCKYDFCFICLQSFPCATGAYDPCKIAPRQQPTSVPTNLHPSLPPQPHSARARSTLLPRPHRPLLPNRPPSPRHHSPSPPPIPPRHRRRPPPPPIPPGHRPHPSHFPPSWSFYGDPYTPAPPPTLSLPSYNFPPPSLWSLYGYPSPSALQARQFELYGDPSHNYHVNQSFPLPYLSNASYGYPAFSYQGPRY